MGQLQGSGAVWLCGGRVACGCVCVCVCVRLCVCVGGSAGGYSDSLNWDTGSLPQQHTKYRANQPEWAEDTHAAHITRQSA